MHDQTACKGKKIESNAERSVTHEGEKNSRSSVQKKTKERERERRGETDEAKTTRNESSKRNRGGGKRAREVSRAKWNRESGGEQTGEARTKRKRRKWHRGMRGARRDVEDSSFFSGTGARLYFGDAGRRTFGPISWSEIATFRRTAPASPGLFRSLF